MPMCLLKRYNLSPMRHFESGITPCSALDFHHVLEILSPTMGKGNIRDMNAHQAGTTEKEFLNFMRRPAKPSPQVMRFQM